MQIKYVDEPIPELKGCRGCYDRINNTLVIKSGMSKKQTYYTISHEFVHYLIDKTFYFRILKHYINLIYDLLDKILVDFWVYLYYNNLKKFIESLYKLINYYRNARKEGYYVY